MKYLILCLSLTQFAHADLDSAQQKGLEDTKAFLQNKTDRDAYVQKNKDAKEADDKVTSLTGGGANKEEAYGISATVMDKLTKDTNGNTDQMKQILEDAQKDPEGFYKKYFDSDAQARTRGLANQIQPSGGNIAPAK